MKTRQLGNQGLTVSSIGLGCMGMSEFYGGFDEQNSFATLSKALDIGVKFWDTADIYGPYTNEELLGKYFSQHPSAREQIVLASKFGIVRSDKGEFVGLNGRPEYIKTSCDASLKRLGVDQLDVYYQHRIDPNVPIEESVGALADLVSDGKIKYIGLSEATSDQLERANKVHPISVLQTEYSLWSREIEQQILPTCNKLGIGFVAYSPLGRGFLTGAFKSRDDFEKGDWRLENPRFSEENFQQNLVVVERINALAIAKNCTPAQLALAWISHQNENYVPIPGTRNIHRLIENAGSIEISLSPEEIQNITNEFPSELVHGGRYD